MKYDIEWQATGFFTIDADTPESADQQAKDYLDFELAGLDWSSYKFDVEESE